MILCGPFCFYQDYITFIDGTNYSQPADATATPAAAAAAVCSVSVCLRRVKILKYFDSLASDKLYWTHSMGP